MNYEDDGASCYRSYVLIVNAQPVHSALPQRQFADQALRFVILGEKPLLGSESLAMRKAASVDGHASVFFVQQFVVHHEIQREGGNFGIVQSDRDHDGVAARLIMAEFASRERAVPGESGLWHQSAEVFVVDPRENLVQVVRAPSRRRRGRRGERLKLE